MKPKVKRLGGSRKAAARSDYQYRGGSYHVTVAFRRLTSPNGKLALIATMSLEDFKDIVATSASITTMGHMLAGTFICKDIFRKGTSQGVDPMPFVGGVGMCLLMLRYALILGDEAMISVNVFGLVTNTLYMIVYYFYTEKKTETLALVGKSLAFIMVFLGYAQMEHPDKIAFRFGIVVTVLLLTLIASPLVHLGEVIRTRSTEMLPFPLIFMGTLVSFQWLLYGLIIDNGFIIFQNAIGFALSLIQMSLFAIYPSSSKKKE